MIKHYGNWWYPSNQPDFTKQKYPTNIPPCIIVDIDWTLSNMDHKRSPYEFEKIKWDRLNVSLSTILGGLFRSFDIYIFSWREDSCMKETKEWLEQKWVCYNGLFMRKAGDKREESTIKKEMFEENIKQPVLAVFDDRQQVVDMWRLELWLPCYQVWYWNF